jgi:diguanylate cyclase (GGDEF)-like protein
MTFKGRALALATIAALYLAAAKFGFTMAFTAEQVTLVWPPTGFALAMLLLFGRRLWPAIFAGAFLANITTHEPVAVAVAIAAGNTAEAVLAAWLIAKYVPLGDSLGRMRQALGVVVFGAGLSTLVSATIGVASLCLGGLQPWSAFGALWWTWWLGDATGDLLVAPLLLTCRGWRVDWEAAGILEAVLLGGGLALASVGVFVSGRTVGAAHYPLEFLVFPFLTWAAIRFGVAGASIANLLTASVAVWGTVHGPGSYAAGDVADHLMLLQVFLAVAAGTSLLLGAAVTEHRSALRCRDAEHAVSRVLAEAATADEATARILDVIMADLHWDIGLRWAVDVEAKLLRCVEVRCRASSGFRELERVSRARTLRPGEGLPGHVWAYAAPQWIPNIQHERQFTGLAAAVEQGLHAAFAFPISVGTNVLGVFEFLARPVRQPDEGLLWTLSAIGAHVGQFLVRKRAEHELAFRAAHDGLTHSLNRAAFMDRLREAGERAHDSGGLISVLFIDIDRFKTINDRFGHVVGDRVLAETARRLRRCLRPGDAVARLGGDEFAVLLERVTGEDDASTVATRMQASLDRPFEVQGQVLTVAASIGIALSETGRQGSEDLLRAADEAMYVKKGCKAAR